MKYKLLRMVAIILSLFITSTTIITASAAEPQYAPSHHLYNAFMQNSYPEICNGQRMYLMTLEESDNTNYLFFINERWLMEKASWFLDKDLDEARCTEILSNIVTMVNHQLEDSITMQASENTKKQIIDFALDSVGVVTGFVGVDDAFKDVSKEVIRNIPTITGIAADVLDLTVDSIKELELLNQLLGDYTMQYDFLNAVATYSDLEPMRAAAKTLLQTNEQILSYKLDTFANVSDATAEFLAKDIFIDKIAEEMLNDPSNFSDESTMFAASLMVGAHKIVCSVEIAFNFTILIGDGLFGTNNQYQQYTEMLAMRDIRSGLIEYIDNHAVASETDQKRMEKNIAILKILQYVDAWGETCLYTGIKSEGTFYGDFWPRDLTIIENNYRRSLDFLASRIELLESIYIDITPVEDITPPEIMTEEDRVASLYDIVGNTTGGYCHWLVEGDFDDDGDSEIYAFICDAEKDYQNGAVWYLSEDKEQCLFWLTKGEGDFFLSIVEHLSANLAVKAICFAEYIFEILSDF